MKKVQGGKKMLQRFRQVTVREWFEKRGDDVYLIWEFQDGFKWERLTPYKEIPWVKATLPLYGKEIK